MKKTYAQLYLSAIKKSICILVVTGVLYAFSVKFIDLPISEWVSQANDGLLTDYSRMISAVFDPTMMMVLIALFFVVSTIGLWMRKWNGAVLNYLNSCALITIFSDVIVSFFKIALGRARPDLFMKKHIVGFYPFKNSYEYLSSPSGHVFIATACVLVIFGLTQKLWARALAIFFLASVVLARVILLKHYLGDCMLSIGLTWACFEYRAIFYNAILGCMTKNRLHTQV